MTEISLESKNVVFILFICIWLLFMLYIFFLSLKILQLQKRLQQQFVIRRVLEKACYLPFSQDATVDNSIPEVSHYHLKQLHMEVQFCSPFFKVCWVLLLTINYIYLLLNFRPQRN